MILKKKQKNDYTVVSNKILRSDLSLQAIGLYLYLTSKPNDWTFTIEGTSKQVNSGRHAITSAFKELEKLGFVQKVQKRECGKLAENTLILTDLSLAEKPLTEKPLTENQLQVNTNIVNTNLVNTNIREIYSKFAKSKSLESANDPQYFQDLSEKYQVPISFVVSKYEDLVNYCQASGKKYKNYKAALLNFVKKDSLAIKQRHSNVALKHGIDASHLG